jgi:hypothetical protein
MARCPACGIQRIQCDVHGDDRTLDARAVWTGAAPTVTGDYRQRVAEAIAAKFTYSVYRCDRDGENERVENPESADRIDQTPYVMVTAGDGCRSFWTPTCAELADAIVAVRDQDAETLRSDNEDLRKRAELAEADARHLRTKVSQIEPEIARLRDNANRPGCVGCMEREHQRELWAERSRQNGISYKQAKQRWYEQQDRAEDAEQGLASAETVIDDLAQIVRDLADPGPCEDFDHDGQCQTHGWLQDGVCPHARARDILTAQEAGEHRG